MEPPGPEGPEAPDARGSAPAANPAAEEASKAQVAYVRANSGLTAVPAKVRAAPLTVFPLAPATAGPPAAFAPSPACLCADRHRSCL